MLQLSTKSADDTKAVGAAIASAVVDSDMVMLVGDMGAGKTTFTQGFAVALGIEDAVTSPTFVLMQSYSGRVRLHHVDIYRLDHLQEVIDLGLVELLDEGGVALVEWGDLATPVLPQDYLQVRLEVGDNDDARLVTLTPVGTSWSNRESYLADCLKPWLEKGNSQ